ncbi:MAG: helix-turn-helix transcriptional regulator [Gemmatimonadota bacterium]
MTDSSKSRKPKIRMTPTYFHILLSLVDEKKHGYSLMQEIDQRTNGSLRLRPGSLYWSLNRLLEAGLIEEVDSPGNPDQTDERRRYYRLTEAGVDLLTREAEVWAEITQLAVEKKVIRNPGLA